MRLTDEQRQSIKTIVSRFLGPESRVWLFGSRVNDRLKGGDIDLLVETDQAIANRVDVLCRLEGALVMALGNRKLDILLKDASVPEVPIYRAAKQTGVVL